MTESDPAATDDESIHNRISEWFRSVLATNIPHVPSEYVAGGAAVVMLLVIASTPAAAQEFCDDAAGTLLINIETMIFNYGTALLVIAFLIGIPMWALEPVFIGQSAIGLALIILSMGAAIAFVLGMQFFGMAFDAAGAGGDSCSTLLD